jgi:hypothetical protein
LSGTVRAAGSQSVIAGATVTVGSASTTTAANGSFELLNVPVGSVNVSASANRFDADTKTITVKAGANSIDLFLATRTLYTRDDIVAFLPPAVSTFRGVIFFLPGFTGDSRPLVRGDPSLPGCFDWCGTIRTTMRQRSLQLAETYGLAVLGMNSMPNEASTWNAMLAALTSFAEQSGQPELAQVPLLLVGHSAGGCLAYGFTRVHSTRVIGFMSGKGQCHEPYNGGLARPVPAYFFIGENDSQSRYLNITILFEANRANRALWAVAIEPEAEHEVIRDVDLQINWMDAVLARRLPAASAGGPVTLSPINESSGWLANRTTGTIAAFDCYNDDPLLASWLPTEQTARDWQSMVWGNGGVTTCN